MKPASFPSIAHHTVKSRAKGSNGQLVGEWCIKFTLPKNFPVKSIEVDGFTWPAGRQEWRCLFQGDDTKANERRAQKDGDALLSNLKAKLAEIEANPAGVKQHVTTWPDLWADYAPLNKAEEMSGRGERKVFFGRWRHIAPYVDFPVRDLDERGNNRFRLRGYLEGMLSSDDPSPRMFTGRHGKPDYESRETTTLTTMEGYQVLLKTLARWGVERGLISIVDAPAFQFHAEKGKREGVWTWEQLQALWTAAPLWDGELSYLHLFAWILIGSGQRLGRIEHLKWDNVVNESGVPWSRCGGPGAARESYFDFGGAYANTAVRRRNNKKAATQQIQDIDLLDVLARAFEARDPANPYLLGRLKTAADEWREFVKTVSAAKPELAIPCLSPHHVRHSLATHLLGDEERSSASVAAFLGCSIRVLEQHYAHLTAKHGKGIAGLIATRINPRRPLPAGISRAAE